MCWLIVEHIQRCMHGYNNVILNLAERPPQCIFNNNNNRTQWPLLQNSNHQHSDMFRPKGLVWVGQILSSQASLGSASEQGHMGLSDQKSYWTMPLQNCEDMVKSSCGKGAHSWCQRHTHRLAWWGGSLWRSLALCTWWCPHDYQLAHAAHSLAEVCWALRSSTPALDSCRTSTWVMNSWKTTETAKPALWSS